MKKVSERIIGEGNFLSLKESVFLNDDGKEVKWESVVRKNKRAVISIIAKLMPSERYVLIRQFRAAVNNHVLGFPAGISDGDDIKKEALRELKEETGYTGTSVELSPCFKSGAAVIDDEVFIASVLIDEKDPATKSLCRNWSRTSRLR